MQPLNPPSPSADVAQARTRRNADTRSDDTFARVLKRETPREGVQHGDSREAQTAHGVHKDVREREQESTAPNKTENTHSVERRRNEVARASSAKKTERSEAEAAPTTPTSPVEQANNAPSSTGVAQASTPAPTDHLVEVLFADSLLSATAVAGDAAAASTATSAITKSLSSTAATLATSSLPSIATTGTTQATGGSIVTMTPTSETPTLQTGVIINAETMQNTAPETKDAVTAENKQELLGNSPLPVAPSEQASTKPVGLLANPHTTEHHPKTQEPSPSTSHFVSPAAPFHASEAGKLHASPSSVFNAPLATPPEAAKQLLHVLRPLKHNPDGDYQMTLQLRPEELGKVEVSVTLKGGEINMQLSADNASARELLKQALGDLRGSLESSGLSTGELDVSSQDTNNLAESDIFTPEFDQNADDSNEDFFLAGLTSVVSEPLSDGSLDVHV